jgi:hypothetical protein
VAKGQKYGGRVKGTPNKLTGDLKAMISRALVAAGGVEYLVAQASANPPAFLGLFGKTLPKDVNLSATGSLKLTMYLSTGCPPTTPTST